MSRRFLVFSAAVAFSVSLSQSVHAIEIQGYPGSTWGNISHDLDRLVGTGAMGYVNQGIDWVTLPGEITFNTFAEFRYRFRNENEEFYNAYSEAVGLEFKRSPFRLGMDYVWERFPEAGEGSDKVQYYLAWYYDWDLKRALQSALKLRGFPGSTWGTVSHDVDTLVGTGTMGNVNQGIDWITLPGEIIINTFAEYRWRFRNRNDDFYDATSKAVGMDLRRSPLHLGVAYVWERFPNIGERSSKFQYYLTWYYDWDLKLSSGGNKR